MQAFTVHYWGAMYAIFFFVLGLGAWLTDGETRQAVRSPAKPQGGRGLVTATIRHHRPIASAKSLGCTRLARHGTDRAIGGSQ